jgi:hypothetical protein
MTHDREFSVAVHAPLAVPPQSAYAMLARSLSDLAQKRGAVCLTLRLEDLQLPVSATISVPVAIHTEPSRESEFDIAIDGLAQSSLYPRFRGKIGVAGGSGNRAEISMNGSYSVPMGWIGKAVDSTLLQGAAAASLTEFLLRLVSEIEQAVKRDEIAHARAVLHQHV